MMTDSFPNEVEIKTTQVRILLDYAQSNNLEVTSDQLTRYHEVNQDSEGYQKLDILFNELSQLVHPVTINTLHASDDHAADLLDPLYKGNGSQTWSSPRQQTKDLLTFTWITTTILLLLVMGRGMFNHILDLLNVTQDVIRENPNFIFDVSSFHFLILFQIFLDHLVPFTYGALGACAYVMIEGNNFIWNKTFDAHLIPKDRMRILIGALSGVIGIMLFKPLFGDQTATTALLDLSEAGIAFIAGYSTDFLFERLSRIISAIVPRTQETPQKETIKPFTKKSLTAGENAGAGKEHSKSRLIVENTIDPKNEGKSLPAQPTETRN